MMKKIFLFSLLTTLALVAVQLTAQDTTPAVVTPAPTPAPAPVPGAWIVDRVYPMPKQMMLLPRYPLDFGKPVETIKAGTFEKPTPIPAGVLLHVLEVRSDRSGNFYYVELAPLPGADPAVAPVKGWIDGQQADPLKIEPVPTPEVTPTPGVRPTATPEINWKNLQFVDQHGRPRMMLTGPRRSKNAPSAAMQNSYPGPTPRPIPRYETSYNTGATLRSTKSNVR